MSSSNHFTSGHSFVDRTDERGHFIPKALHSLHRFHQQMRERNMASERQVAVLTCNLCGLQPVSQETGKGQRPDLCVARSSPSEQRKVARCSSGFMHNRCDESLTSIRQTVGVGKSWSQNVATLLDLSREMVDPFSSLTVHTPAAHVTSSWSSPL